MGREPIALRGSKIPLPTMEAYSGWKLQAQTITANTLAEIPSTITSGRQYVMIQNLSATDVYIGSDIPDLYIWGRDTGFDRTIACTRKYLKWTESPTKANEYYAEIGTEAGGDPSLTEPLRMYGIVTSGGSEAALTEGSIGTLNDLEWVWGNNDTLGYNTVYFRIDADDPDDLTSYLVLYGYPVIPTVTGSGHHLGQYDSIEVSLTSAARIFAISDTNSDLIISEFVSLVQY